MIMKDADIKREAEDDGLRAVMIDMVDCMIANVQAGDVMIDMVDEMIADNKQAIDGDRICPVCGSIVVDGVCEDVGDSGCRWTVVESDGDV